jgi:hypothetical protein
MTGIIAVVNLTDLDLYQDHVVKRNAGKAQTGGPGDEGRPELPANSKTIRAQSP